jgi:hypothetical protein
MIVRCLALLSSTPDRHLFPSLLQTSTPSLPGSTSSSTARINMSGSLPALTHPIRIGSMFDLFPVSFFYIELKVGFFSPQTNGVLYPRRPACR